MPSCHLDGAVQMIMPSGFIIKEPSDASFRGFSWKNMSCMEALFYDFLFDFI